MGDAELLAKLDECLSRAQDDARRAVGPVVLKCLAGMGLVVVPAWVVTSLAKVIAGPKDSETSPGASEDPR